MKYLNAFLALVFALFAAVQYNDPDPVVWMLAYGAVCVFCVLAVMGRHHPRSLLVLAVVLAGWMATMVPGFIAWLRMGMPTITGTMKAESPHVEVVREFLGLGIAVAAVLHLWRLARKAA